MAFDIVLTEPISQYFELNFTDKFALSRAGLISPLFDNFAAEGGKRVTLPFWTRDTTASVANDGSAVTFYQAASKPELAYVQRRSRARKQTQAEVQALGSQGTPLDHFMVETIDYWAREMEKSFWDGIIKGVFDPSNGILTATHSKSVAKTSGTPQPATRDYIRLAKALLGDSAQDLKVMVCRSEVATDLKAQDSARAVGMYNPSDFEGMVVLEDDNIPTLGGTGDFVLYPTFMFGAGALGLSIQKQLETKIAWLPTINSDVMNQDCSWAPHLFGVSFTGTPASEEAGPTNAEYATYSNWTARANVTTKDIKIACLISNISKR